MAIRRMPGQAPIKKSNALSQARGLIDKAFPKNELFADFNEDAMKESRPHLPSGSLIIDYLIGGRLNRFGIRPCPGFPRKGLVNLYGQESSGKTTVALTVAGMTCAMGGTVCYIDWEHAVDVSYAKSLGVPIDNPEAFILAQPESLEKGMSILWTMAKAGADLIVIDSIGAGVPEEILKQSIAQKGEMGRIGLNAAKWSRILPELKSVINQSGTCVIGISQLRKKIGMTGYGEGSDTQAQGGEAWKFWSEVRIGLKRVASEKGKEYNPLTHKVEEALVGQTVRCRIDKCKISASQGKAAEFYIRFGDGIDDLRSVIEVSTAHGIVKKGGAWLSYERPGGVIIKGCGVDDFKEKVKETEGAWDELYLAVVKALSEKPGKIVMDVPEDDLSDLDTILAEVASKEVPEDEG